MKKFNFRLQKIMNIKNIQAKVISKDLSLAMAEQIKFEQMKTHMQSEKTKSFVTRQQLLSKASQSGNQTNIEMVNEIENFIIGQDIRIKMIDQRIEEQKSKVEKIRQSLIEKDREQKMLEKVKQLQFESWTKEVDLFEAKETDDLILMRRAKQVNK